MSTIVLRLVKGVPLTNAELDDNFSNLNTDKLEAGTTATLTNKTINLSSNTFVATSAQMATAVSDKTGSGALVFATSPTLVTPALGTPASGVVTNLTGTASININGTVGATTATTGAFTTLTTSSTVTINGGTANGVAYLNGSKVLTTGSALTFDGAKLNNINGASLGVIQSTDTVSTGSFVRMLGDASAGNLINWKNDTVLRFATSADNFSTYTERMRISGTGEVGIGTINPSTKLHVYGFGTTSNNYTNGDAIGATLFLQDAASASGSGGQLLFGSSQGIYAGIKGFLANATGPAGDLLFQTRGTSGNVNERMRIDYLGNVGIGTSSPLGRLSVDLNTASTVTNTLTLNNSSGGAGSGAAVNFYASNTSQPFTGRINSLDDGAFGYHLVFSNKAPGSAGAGALTERMRIDSSGNVGIGTINPSTKLHVYGNGTTSNNYTNGDATGATLFLQDSNGVSGNGGQLLFGSSQGIYAGIKGFVTNGTGPAGDLLFQTRGASGNVNERMRIDSAGNVGIGTNLPVGKLNVIGGLGVGFALTGDQAVTPSSGSVVFSGTNIANIQTYTSPGSSTTLGQIYNYASIADGFARFLDVVAYSSTTGGGSNIRFVTGNGFTNAERVRIDSAGNVGIGTNSVVSPARLDITKATTNNSINTQRQLRIGGDTSAAYSLFIGYGQPVTGQELGGNIQALDNGVGSKLLLNPSGGNVGIGTSSPTTKLHVAGGSLLLGAFGGEGGELSLQNAAGNAVGASLDVDASNNFRIFNVSSSATIFYTGGANERMLITSSGSVGIATNAPTARLDINNQDAADTFPLVVSNNIAGINTASAGIGFNAHTVRFAQVVGGQHEYGSYATGNLRFFTRNAEVVTEKMRIEPSGNVLIGSATPDAGNTLRYLDLYNSNTGASAGSIMRFITSNTAASGLTTVDLVKYKNGTFSINNNETNAAACTTFNVGASERMRITSSGQLLLGITSQIFSGEVLAVNAAGCTAVYRNASTTAGKFWKFPYIDNSNNIFILNQNNAGLYIADGATSWTANSDERVKDIIEPITDAANKVCRLRAVIGKYKTDAVGVRRSFLIAQDVQAVLPEAVNTQSDEMSTLGVQYTDVIPLLVAAIKEQQAIITALTARVAVLESN